MVTYYAPSHQVHACNHGAWPGGAANGRGGLGWGTPHATNAHTDTAMVTAAAAPNTTTGSHPRPV